MKDITNTPISTPRQPEEGQLHGAGVPPAENKKESQKKQKANRKRPETLVPTHSREEKARLRETAAQRGCFLF